MSTVAESGVSVLLRLNGLDICVFTDSSTWQVQLHELGCDGFAKSFVFRGSKDVTTKQLQEQLGLAGGPTGRPQAPAATQQQQQPEIQNRFVFSCEDCFTYIVVGASLHFTKIDIVREACEGQWRVSECSVGDLERRRLKFAHMVLVCASTDDGRPLTGGTNLICRQWSAGSLWVADHAYQKRQRFSS